MFEVRLQRIFLSTLFFKFMLLLQVTPRRLKIQYPNYPAYDAHRPSQEQGECLDDAVTCSGIFGFDVVNQDPPKPITANYENDTSKD